MKIDSLLTDESLLAELGSRLAGHRLNRNLTQAALAKEAGVSLPTVVRLEAGNSVQFLSLVRVLRGLGLLENLEVAVPPPVRSPLDQLRRAGKSRKRASGKRTPDKDKPPWQWSEDT